MSDNEPKSLSGLGQIIRKALRGVQIQEDCGSDEQARRAERCTAELFQQIGNRYWNCTLANFNCSDFKVEYAQNKRRAVALVRHYIKFFDDNIQKGTNLVWLGPKGTGKDHMMAAMLKGAANRGLETMFVNGLDLFGMTRDLIDTKGDEGRESSFVRRFTRPAVLGISDPISQAGSNGSWANDWLYRIVDGRYRLLKPTWITINARDRAGIESLIGATTTDRLYHGAIVIPCDWPTIREKQNLKHGGG